ncbi:MAG: DUF485 domain-containing protein [Acidobacteriia bacterium]|nr:DUF485 domain-containing protein [Terriglobia bacterium]
MPEEIIASQETRAGWDRIAATPEFRGLMTTKKVFIIPVFLFFLVYYFALPLLVGLAPHWMSTKIMGGANRAYVFALSQFVVAWVIAWRYLKAAGKFDRRVQEIVAQADESRGGK